MKRITTEVNFDLTSLEKLNSEFAKVKIRIAYAGVNRNRTKLSTELLEHMARTSLPNIPIVGYWRNDVQNFGGHDGEIQFIGSEMQWVDLTRPYGVVPSDTEVWWEEVREKDGFTVHNYLCCTGILWVGRYPECEKILNDGANQSMEISVSDCDYIEEDDIVDIKAAEFSALCILAKDERESVNVEPCFEQANIASYSFDKFKAEFTLLMDNLRKFNTSEVKETVDNPTIEPIVEETTETVECTSEEVVATATEELVEQPTDKTETVDEQQTTEIEEQSTEEIENVEEQTTEEVEAVDEQQMALNELEEKYNNLVAEFEEYKATHSATNEEVEELRQFKTDTLDAQLKSDIAEVIEEFSDLSGNSDFKTLIEDTSMYKSAEEFKEKCELLYGRLERAKRKLANKKDKYTNVSVQQIVDEVVDPRTEFIHTYKH